MVWTERDDRLMALPESPWFTCSMTDYTFHWWSTNGRGATTPHVALVAPSHLHGAALALRQFVLLGCDLAAPLAHVDVIEPDGSKQTLLVEEVLTWLNKSEQQAFVNREQLHNLLH